MIRLRTYLTHMTVNITVLAFCCIIDSLLINFHYNTNHITIAFAFYFSWPCLHRVSLSAFLQYVQSNIIIDAHAILS